MVEIALRHCHLQKSTSPLQLRVGQWLNAEMPGSNAVITMATSSDPSVLYVNEEEEDKKATEIPPQVPLVPWYLMEISSMHWVDTENS